MIFFKTCFKLLKKYYFLMAWKKWKLSKKQLLVQVMSYFKCEEVL